MFPDSLIDRRVSLNGRTTMFFPSSLSTSLHPSLQRRGMKKPPSPHLWERVGVRGEWSAKAGNIYKDDNLGAFPGLGHFL